MLLVRNAVYLCLAGVLLHLQASVLRAQQPSDPDKKQIEVLINRLIANTNVSELLDPQLQPAEREKQLNLIPHTYDMTLVPDGPVVISGTTAQIPVDF